MKRFGSFLVGGLMGVGLALWVTPRVTQRTRDQIRDRAQDLKDRTSSALSQGRLRATELMGTLDDKLTQVKNKAGSLGAQGGSAPEPAPAAGEKVAPQGAEQAVELGEHPASRRENA